MTLTDKPFADHGAHVLDMVGPKQRLTRLGCVLIAMHESNPDLKSEYAILDEDGIC